jgi:hypothetical protein
LQLLCDDLAAAAERRQQRPTDPVNDQIARELAERQNAVGAQS